MALPQDLFSAPLASFCSSDAFLCLPEEEVEEECDEEEVRKENEGGEERRRRRSQENVAFTGLLR